MEKRIGVVAILIDKRDSIKFLNEIFSEFNQTILGRQGLPLREKNVHIISLIVEGTTDQIGALTGKIGKLKGIQVKSVLTKFKETDNADQDKTIS